MPKRIPSKTIVKSLRLNEKEARLIDENLQKSGLSFSQYAIKRLCGYQVRAAIDKQILFELSKIGNNLNQITRKLNQGSPFDAAAMIVLNTLKERIGYVGEILSQS